MLGEKCMFLGVLLIVFSSLNTSIAHASYQSPFKDGQVWEGTYRCGNTQRQLELIFHSTSNNELRAFFYFDKGKFTEGLYLLSGQYNAQSGGVSLTPETPNAWLVKPAGFYQIGLKGLVRGKKEREFNGSLKGCLGGFNLVLIPSNNATESLNYVTEKLIAASDSSTRINTNPISACVDQNETDNVSTIQFANFNWGDKEKCFKERILNTTFFSSVKDQKRDTFSVPFSQKFVDYPDIKSKLDEFHFSFIFSRAAKTAQQIGMTLEKPYTYSLFDCRNKSHECYSNIKKAIFSYGYVYFSNYSKKAIFYSFNGHNYSTMGYRDILPTLKLKYGEPVQIGDLYYWEKNNIALFFLAPKGSHDNWSTTYINFSELHNLRTTLDSKIKEINEQNVVVQKNQEKSGKQKVKGVF